MIYKLASRDNIDHERFESWPAVLNNAFNKFNNFIEEPTFHSEDELLNWLDSRCRTKSVNRAINIQEFRNGDPNKLYSVYVSDSDDIENQLLNSTENGYRFLYSLRIKKPYETFMTYLNEKGIRVKSSFKKIENKIDYATLFQVDVDNSSDARMINREFIEGIYPIESDEKDLLHERYMKFIKDVHEKDTEDNKAKEYSVVYASSGVAIRWLDQFVKKLDQVERFLDFFAKGGNNFVFIQRDPEHNSLLKYMFKLLDDNRLDTPHDDLMQSNIRNMMIDPYLATNEIYQVRYNKTLISWHKNYIHIIKKTGMIPSRQFSELIVNFSIMDFFKQFHSKENIEAMINNIKDIYGIQNDRNAEADKIRYIRKKTAGDQPKFLKVVKSFNN